MKSSEEKETTQEPHNSDVIVQEVDGVQQPLPTFKLVVVGESFAGKTSLIKRFLSRGYEQSYNVTVGADFNSRPITVSQGNRVQLQIWDTCGHDVYRSMTSSFYRGACGVLLVFSIVDRNSFDKIATWHRQFIEEANPQAQVFLVGTKVDEKGRKVAAEEALALMKQIKAAFYMETSARTGEKVDQVFQGAADIFFKLQQVSEQFRILANPRKFHQSSILIASDHQQPKGLPKKKCC